MNPLPVSRDRAGLQPVAIPEVDRSYWVSFVKVNDLRPTGGRWRPVLGPLHTDAEIVNFPHEHWHVDWRFAPEAFWQGAARYAPAVSASKAHGVVVVHRRKNSAELGTNGVLYRRFVRCLRPMPAYLPTDYHVPWLAELEEDMASKGARMKCLKCPHRGLPLLDELTDAKGVVTCQGHGLRWRVKSGKLVRTQAKKTPQPKGAHS